MPSINVNWISSPLRLMLLTLLFKSAEDESLPFSIRLIFLHGWCRCAWPRWRSPPARGGLQQKPRGPGSRQRACTEGREPCCSPESWSKPTGSERSSGTAPYPAVHVPSAMRQFTCRKHTVFGQHLSGLLLTVQGKINNDYCCTFW